MAALTWLGLRHKRPGVLSIHQTTCKSVRSGKLGWQVVNECAVCWLGFETDLEEHGDQGAGVISWVQLNEGSHEQRGPRACLLVYCPDPFTISRLRRKAHPT
jgi:hypothetical protein